MQSSADAYAASFDARCASATRPGADRVSGPGMVGVVSSDGDSPNQLLVLDDRAFDELSALLPKLSSGTVRVYDAASRCAALLGQDRRWRPNPATGMVCSDLRAVPDVPMPSGLSLRRVRRSAGDPPDGVPLTDAVDACRRATGATEARAASLVTYLRSLPADARLFAGVDGDGVVRGTSGSRTFGSEAYVFFVNTDPRWRRRGVGQSMTVAALRAAAASGATRATLDSSELGVGVYARLGFAPVGGLTQFSRPD